MSEPVIRAIAPYGLSLFDKFLWYGWDEADDGCWNWSGPVDTKGYGRLHTKGKTVKAHRLSLRYHTGSLDEDMAVLHSCDNPLCVNPGHLREGTRGENSRDMVLRRRSLSGERHNNAKLNWGQVREIRNNPDGLTTSKLAKKYGVSTTHIRYIVNGKNWKESDRDV